MAASTLSFGMLGPRAFCSARRRAGLLSGFGPPAFTAMAMSLAMRVNTFAIRFHRANIVALRVSKMRPMVSYSRWVAASSCRAGYRTDPSRAPATSLPDMMSDGVSAHMLYRALADAVVLLHLGVVVFIALGGLLAWRWPAA